MPHHMIESTGHRIYYEVTNHEAELSGKKLHRILFTTGLGGNHLHWAEQLEYFGQHDDFTVCVYDNRGAGLSDSVGGRWTTDSMAQDAIALLDHLGWRDRVHLVGVSMGGMITQRIALLDLQRFASMTLISTIAGGLPSLVHFARVLPTGITKLFMGFFSKRPRDQLKHMLGLLFPESYLQSNNVFEELSRSFIQRGREAKQKGISNQVPTSTFAKQVLAVTTHNVSTEELNRLNNHFGEAAMILTGDSDILVHQDNSRVLRKGLKQSKFMKFENGGHGITVQYPGEINRLIHDIVLIGDSKL